MRLPADLEIARNLPPAGSSLEAAEKYTGWLATHHYENFTVASWLLPRVLRQDFYNVYAYCRWADDLADEIEDPHVAMEALNWWGAELQQCYAGHATHPVFIALRKTAGRFDIPIDPFRDLLTAFRQDQTVHRHPSWDSVLQYCRYSANPVGHLVLYLFGYGDAERHRLSDYTCTALQLANFWQDVSRDLEKDRIYIPLDLLSSFGVTESDLFARRSGSGYTELMRDLVERTRELFRLGRPLALSVAPEFRLDLELFTRGGLAVLDAIESIGYNTLATRPTITRAKKFRLMIQYAGRNTFSRLVRVLPQNRPHGCA
jgi:squalene synthase HpnC